MNSEKVSTPSLYPHLLTRLGAYLLDYLLLFAVLIPSQIALFVLADGFPFTRFENGWQVEGWVLLSVSLPAWLYFSLSEGSRRGATLGKRILGTRVVKISGGQASFGRALLRTAVKLLPWELTHLTLLLPTPLLWEAEPEFRIGLSLVYFLLGAYLAMMWRNQKNRGPHDLAAGTVVVKVREGD